MDKQWRRTVRDEREQLVTLVNVWDPIGRLAAGAPRDEYDAVIDELLALLSRGATKDEISEFLDREITGHFGTQPKDTGQFATRAVAWYRMLSGDRE